MPILPLIDLLLLAGTASLFVGFLLKALSITTRFHPHVLGFTSIDFVLIAGVCMGMALVLAARTWVKLHEPRLVALRRRTLEETFRREQIELEREAAGLGEDGLEVLGTPATQARAGRPGSGASRLGGSAGPARGRGGAEASVPARDEAERGERHLLVERRHAAQDLVGLP